ncbi:Txe/YoeB family addiction module toxin [Waterburya agarophytonicola K14]|uniref:Endoribonuclease YoeB n=1 Tax=Waterburya agarophytonicola KI4 TaxID=2874699 RepID=A0A964BQ07_9CYAN|nr:Txe/YoeB family addiction module toxin [Waterburya agarophytonicola]MCC0177174.1 Txe/YoeB family addiction module toxin [Waterburya agarophytonicola KI4]
MAKKKQSKKSKDEPLPLQPVVIHRVPGFSSQFKEDLGWWFKQDTKKAYKILDLVTVVMQYPFKGIGKPEPLKYMDGNIWSRRIDLEHRFIYIVGKSQIDFIFCRFHYE